jgi:hypothetical protein
MTIQKSHKFYSGLERRMILLMIRNGDFQERCHSLAAFQAAWINGSAWLD